jgi:hypothetical protein
VHVCACDEVALGSPDGSVQVQLRSVCVRVCVHVCACDEVALGSPDDSVQVQLRSVCVCVFVRACVHTCVCLHVFVCVCVCRADCAKVTFGCVCVMCLVR